MIVARRVQKAARTHRATGSTVATFTNVRHEIRRKRPAARAPPFVIEFVEVRPFRSATGLAAFFPIMHKTRDPFSISSIEPGERTIHATETVRSHMLQRRGIENLD